MPPRKQKNLFSTLLPSWIPEKVFNEYVLMRKSLKKPLNTDYTIELAIGKVEELKKDGYSPEDVLNQSILNSYIGLFPVKGASIGTQPKPSSMDKTLSALDKARILVEGKEQQKALGGGDGLEDFQ